jgi:hypothetical protein
MEFSLTGRSSLENVPTRDGAKLLIDQGTRRAAPAHPARIREFQSVDRRPEGDGAHSDPTIGTSTPFEAGIRLFSGTGMAANGALTRARSLELA